MINAKTLKGFRDFLPSEARKRQYVIDTLKEVFELYGFEPLETPALEYAEIMEGKYGEEGDKLIYKFEDLGKRKVALRYDQTVPLARVVAQYGSAGSPQVLPMPFKRYQIQPVWRAENPQKGRFREFLQCDCDIVGSFSALSDAEVITTAAKSIEKLGFINYKILINDRENLFVFEQEKEPDLEKGIKIIRAVDKLKKIGRDKVVEEVMELELSLKEATDILDTIEKKKPTKRMNDILSCIEKLGIESSKVEFLPTLARGLDYYTSTIFELEIEGYEAGSVCGGGRYDNLIGMFRNEQIPAVGFAFGFDRLIEAMEELNLFPKELSGTKVLVTVFGSELKDKSIEIVSLLRSKNINTELYLDENTKMEKQLKYADQKNIPYVIIIGPNEAQKETVMLKDMRTGEQKEISQSEIFDVIQ